MKKLSISKMADTVISKRKELKITQVQLAEKTGINRGMISRLESCDYTPSIEQLQSIAEILDFEVVDLFEDDKPTVQKPVVGKKYNIAVAGTGYVGLSIATLLSQHNHVTAVDIIPEKVELINNRKSPIQDASSSSVYGTNKKVPYSTDDKVDNPVSLYAATKKSNELMAHAYSKLYNVDQIVLGALQPFFCHQLLLVELLARAKA